MDKRIHFVTELLLKELHTPPNVEELAVRINISPSRLRQMFKTETGLPYGEYLRELRLEHSRRLLQTTFMRVQEIGFAAGFRDQSYFNRLFKKKYGLTPKEYRSANHHGLNQSNEKT